MSKTQKRLTKLSGHPKDFAWDEAVSLMEGLGFKMMKSSGSSRKFYHAANDVLILMHEPHPAKVLKRYQIDDILTGLVDGEVINSDYTLKT